MPPHDETLTVPLRLALLGDFLRSRRARLTPEDVGLPAVGRRRTAGLRREEVAQLAGRSPVWYTHLEQGRAVHPSRDALGALANALQLDATERAYLFQLAYGLHHTGDRRTAITARALPVTRDAPSPSGLGGPLLSLRRLLDALGPTPALVITRCWDVAGCNAAFAAALPVFAPYAAGRPAPNAPPFNVVEYVLTDPTWRAAMHDWPRVARTAVDGLRAGMAGVAPDDPLSARATALVARLTAVSPAFRAWWPAHGLWVADYATTHAYEHPAVGRLELDVTLLDVRSAPGLTLLTYVPCDLATTDRLRQLLAATPNT